MSVLEEGQEVLFDLKVVIVGKIIDHFLECFSGFVDIGFPASALNNGEHLIQMGQSDMESLFWACS